MRHRTLEPLAKDSPWWTGVLGRYRLTSPRRGRLVRIMKGKHKGVVGRVVWHGLNQHAQVRSLGAADEWIREAAGRLGYRIGVAREGAPAIFTNAEYAVICVEDLPNE